MLELIKFFEECDLNEYYYDDYISKQFAEAIFGWEFSDVSRNTILNNKICKISGKIYREIGYNANRIIAHPIIQSLVFELMPTYHNNLAKGGGEHICGIYSIKYDEKINYDTIYVVYYKNSIKLGGEIKLKNIHVPVVDEILDKINISGVKSLNNTELILLNIASK